MRIKVISDNHSLFERLTGSFDAAISCGDFFPDSIDILYADYANTNKHREYQLKWLRENALNIKRWLDGKDFLFINGNHDFLSEDIIVDELKSVGINCISLKDNIVNYNSGISIYGFPYIPYIGGKWNYELMPPDMNKECDKLIQILQNNRIDILVCHAPLQGVLDLSTERLTGISYNYGNSILLNKLNNLLEKDRLPDFFLCGHIHQSNGVSFYNKMICVNSATIQHIIEI